MSDKCYTHNSLDHTCSVSDDELSHRFKEAVRIENETKKHKGLPIANVPKEKILSRYDQALKLIPELLEVCDVCHIYDNSDEPARMFKKRKSEYFLLGKPILEKSNLENLTKMSF